jgi:hypothetical protein
LQLPQDALSTSILSFMHHFSLPLEQEAAAKIRRLAIPLEQQTGRERPGFREALSLAAASALDKGVELSREALERYAVALSPEAPEEQTGDSGREGSDDNNGNRTASGDSSGNDGREKQENRAGQKLKEQLRLIEGADPLLSLLNRLPGKNGQRWIVLPFTVKEQGAEYRISLRILLDGNDPKHEAGRLALDAAGEKGRHLFILDRFRDGNSRLRVQVWPARGKRSLNSLKKELSALFNLQTELIQVQNTNEFSQFASDCREEVLLSINKEV